jgi:hypothetical protein
MILEDSRLQSKLPDDELDKLLSGSRLFPDSSGVSINYREREAEEVLKKSNLYEIANASGEFKLKVPQLPKKRKRAKKEENDAGKNWFFMKKPEMTPEVQDDLNAIMMRKFVDPKRFYKKSDMNKAPKFFQVGTLYNAADEPWNKVDKEYKGKSLVEQLLVDDEKIKFTHKKWQETHKDKGRKKSRTGLKKSQKKRKLGFR